MSRKTFWLVSLAVIVMTLVPSIGYATGIMDNVMQRFHSVSSGWSSVFLSAAERLFWVLVPIGMVWRFGMQVVKGGGATEVLADFVRFTVFIGFFFWLCLHGVSIGESIINSLKQLAGSVSGRTGLNPSDIMDVGFSTFSTILTAFSVLSWRQVPEGIIMLLSGIVFVLICALVAINMLLALVGAWILMYAGVFILGFGGSAWTSEMAISYFRAVFGAGLRIMGMILVVGICSSVLHQYADNVKLASLGDIVALLVVSVIMYLLSEKIPEQMASLPSGSIGSNGAISGGAAVGASMAAGAMLAQGVKMAATAMSGGAMGVAGATQAVRAAISEAQNNLTQGEGAESSSEAIGGLSEAMGMGNNSTAAKDDDFGGDSVSGGSDDDSGGDAMEGSDGNAATNEAESEGVAAGETVGEDIASSGTESAGSDNVPSGASSSPGKMAVAKGAVDNLVQAGKGMLGDYFSDRIGQSLGGKMADRIRSNGVSGPKAEEAVTAAGTSPDAPTSGCTTGSANVAQAGATSASSDTAKSSVPWMHQTGGYNALSDKDKAVAGQNYAKWSQGEGHTLGLEEYVQYAQTQQARRMEAESTNEAIFTPEDKEEIERLSQGAGTV